MLTKSYFPKNWLGKGSNASCKCNEILPGSHSRAGYCAGVMSKQSYWVDGLSWLETSTGHMLGRAISRNPPERAT